MTKIGLKRNKSKVSDKETNVERTSLKILENEKVTLSYL